MPINFSLSCKILKLFDIEEYCDLEIYINGHSSYEFMHKLYIVEIFRPGAIFATDSMGLSSTSLINYTASSRKKLR